MRVIRYTGVVDVTEWLARHSVAPPSLIMHVPCADAVNVGLEMEDNIPYLLMATTLDRKLCKANRLWFVLPLSLVARNATFDDGSPIE